MEKAVKGKYRFPYKGQIAVEDLYDLPLGALDTVFKTLNAEVKKTDEESLLQTKSEEDDILSTKIEIVKYIFNEKLEEKKNRQEAAERKEKKQKIMQIIATKQDEALRNASVEDLQKMLDELD
ncbi:hypothetical protein PMN51_18785 [Blautia wexlerae]|nr:hypothetical protein [Blautia wexlerae]